METNNLSRFDTELKYRVVVDKTDDGKIRFCLIDSGKDGIVLASQLLCIRDWSMLDKMTDEQFIKEVVKSRICGFRMHIRQSLKNGEPAVYISDKRDVKKLSELK